MTRLRLSLFGVRTSVAAVAFAAMLTAACETPEPSAGENGEQASPEAPSSPDQGGGGSSGQDNASGFTPSGDPQFDVWRSGFASRAIIGGRSMAVVREVLDGITPIAPTVQAQSFDNQAEFVKPIWDYARTAVSPTRIANGQQRMADNATILTSLEASYAPPREILASIWGMESSYGSFIGNIDAPTALASQAAIGRRVAFNEGELIAIMKLIEDGSATREQFRKSSWAGAVGQTQFMPTTFVAHARDFDRDGRKDLWTNVGDALASAANYLTASGWRQGEPWAIEITIPAGFDYSLGDGRKLSVAEWSAQGLGPAAATGAIAAPALSAELFLPAGSYGPAFLLFDNFNVIKRYNNADSYALAIGLLADRLAGRPDLSRPWPTDVTLLTQAQVKSLQEGLNRLGYNPGGADGLIGRNTRRALQSFQKDRGLVADGFVTLDMHDRVLAAAG